MAAKSPIDFDHFERSLQNLSEPENKLRECEKTLDRMLLQLGWNGNVLEEMKIKTWIRPAPARKPKKNSAARFVKTNTDKLTGLTEGEDEDEEDE